MNGLSVICVRGAFLFLLYACFTSCAGSKKTSEATVGGVELREDLPQILFLNYSIKKLDTEGYRIELINTIAAPGTVKEVAKHNATEKEGDLKCISLDKDKKVISTVLIPNPLLKRFEYQQEDGSLTTKLVLLDSTDFSIRMQLEEGSRYIAIDRIDPEGSSYLLVTEIGEL